MTCSAYVPRIMRGWEKSTDDISEKWHGTKDDYANECAVIARFLESGDKQWKRQSESKDMRNYESGRLRVTVARLDVPVRVACRGNVIYLERLDAGNAHEAGQ